ncbi:hypothetical protein RND71_034708 [Anisodus tanguticus]|uniref:DDRGK domain-containing protein 1 n=1 Tax=Anisodus tanguticus TaxID=243964 RepID=A0AAE1R5S0_9SOLA|nr:hypothetical protein RND71_034708 [Anisodus tanguticus]
MCCNFIKVDGFDFNVGSLLMSSCCIIGEAFCSTQVQASKFGDLSKVVVFYSQQSFMSDLDLQVPAAFDPFAEANADNSGAGTKDYVHIRIQQRNGRKSLTTVQGLKKEFSYNKILKDLKKEFCCNGTVVQDPELGQVIQLQGDQRKNVSTFLVEAGIRSCSRGRAVVVADRTGGDGELTTRLSVVAVCAPAIARKTGYCTKVLKMEDMLVAILSMLLVLALVPLYLWKRRQNYESSREHEDETQVEQRETVVRATGTRRMRRRPASSAASTSSAADTIDGGLALLGYCPETASPALELADGSDDEEPGDGYYTAKSSKKKEQKHQEREAQRQAEEAARESKQTKQSHYDEVRRRKEEEREAKERALEEEAKARQAKEEEAAALEFEKWKGEISVDAEGTTENEVQDGSQGLLFDFVEYIKKHKCVPLEDLAAEFKLRTQECINRINSLEEMGRLSGIMDDRGKYIYISLEEMRAVADYIRREGRVSISHLASKSNQFIDLEPKVELVEDIGSIEETIVV